MHSRCRLWVQAVWKLIHRRNVENTIPQHGIQPYVRSIISSHIAQFLKNISTRAADVEVFTQPGPKDGVIGRPACRSLEILGAALQADGGTRSAFAASSIRRRSAAWTILPD